MLDVAFDGGESGGDPGAYLVTGSGLETSAGHCIMVECLPVGGREDFANVSVILFRVPVQHLWLEININRFTVCLGNFLPLGEKIICVHEADVAAVNHLLRK